MARADVWMTLKQSQRRARKLAERIGVDKTKKLLKKAHAEMTQRLMQAEGLRGPGKDSFTATQLRVGVRQIAEVIRTLTPEMKDVLVDQAQDASEQAAQNVVDYLNTAETAYKGVTAPLPLNESMMFDRAIYGAESSLLNRIASNPQDPAKLGILQRYGVSVVSQFEALMQQGMLQGKSWIEIRDELIGASPFLQQAPGYWAERIVRTETMGALNRGNWEATRQADATLGDVVKILVATFDDRTGWDSYQVHGQIRLPDEPFEWAGKQYQHPPNRPNDRETVIAHRISWPLPPELAWRGDDEVVARWLADGRAGAPPPRPRMTSVPLDSFGQPAPEVQPQISVTQPEGSPQLEWEFP